MNAHIRRIIPNGGLLSEAQGKAMVTIYASTKNVFVDLRCGEGKTLAYSLPLSMAPRGSVLLVIVPYVALVESTLSALNGYRFQATKFDMTGVRFQPE
jgi:superfamily II DNA helicase RecQ